MKAAIAGSTGFIGQLLIPLLSDDAQFESVTVFSRKQLDLPTKFHLAIGDIAEQELNAIDVAFCSLGTTIATAGSKESFYQVDHDLVIAFGKKAKEAGATTFILVSSVGADAESNNFYLKVKGETEHDLQAIGFDSLIILRPSMLLGKRKEFRFGELIGKGAMPFINPLLLGGLSKYKGIQGKTVARCMHKLASQNLSGVHVLEYKELQAF